MTFFSSKQLGKKFITGLLFLSVSLHAYSQLEITERYKHDYLPFSSSSMTPEELAKINKRFNDRAVLMKKDKSKERKKLLEEYHESSIKMFSRMDSLQLLLSGDPLTLYIKSIVDKLVKANPSLQKKEYFVFTLRSNIPNASSLGEGIVFVNLDLIRKLDNESEIAFVLAHELAHDNKNHGYNRLEQTVAQLTDDDYKKELKRIAKQRYNTKQIYDSYMNKINANRSKYSQSNELEADSLGMVFIINAGYNPERAVETLIKLDSLDKPMFSDPLNFHIFSFENLSFAPLADKKNSELDWKGNISYEIPDSLKTHPECKLRAETLQQGIEKKSTSFYDKNISDFKNLSSFEIIQYYYDRELYSKSLYEAMSFLKFYPENIYLKSIIAVNIFNISESLKRHTFSKTVDMPDTKNTPAYNELLHFLHEQSYSDMNKLVRKFYEVNLEPFSSENQAAAYVGVLLKCRDNKPKEDEYKKEYNQKYPKSKFIFNL